MEIIYVFALISLQFDLSFGDCNSLPVVDNTWNNVTGSGPFASGTAVKFDCDPGFNPTGTSKIYVCSDSTWTNGHLVCQQIYCGHVETPDNGRVVNSPTNTVGSTINFECNTGYEMSGQNTMLCRTDGAWLPSVPPTCVIRSCGEFGSIQHGTTFQDTSNSVRDGYGSVVEVTCKRGFVISGPLNVMCQADGTWGDRPSCEVNSCPPYPGLESSCIQHMQYNSPFLFMMCEENVPVTKTGPDVVECINGAWESTPEVMACYCHCKVEADLNLVSLNNVNLSYLNHESTLAWSCKHGSTKASAAPLVCNDGNVLKPVCTPKVTTAKPVTDTNGNTVNPPTKVTAEPLPKGPGGVVIGVIIGVAVLLGVGLGYLGFRFYKKKRNNSSNEKPTANNRAAPVNEPENSHKETIPLNGSNQPETNNSSNEKPTANNRAAPVNEPENSHKETIPLNGANQPENV